MACHLCLRSWRSPEDLPQNSWHHRYMMWCAWMYTYPYVSGKVNYFVTGMSFGSKAKEVFPPGSVPHFHPVGQDSPHHGRATGDEVGSAVLHGWSREVLRTEGPAIQACVEESVKAGQV